MLRVKGIEDQLSGVRPGAQVHHEALATLWPLTQGFGVPRVRAVAETPDDDGLLALDFVEGRALADLEAEQVTEDLLRTVWAEVDRLHPGRIAHRRLSTDQILIEADGRVDDHRPPLVPSGGGRSPAGRGRGRPPGRHGGDRWR